MNTRIWAAILLCTAIAFLIGVVADWHRTDAPGVGVAWIATAGTVTLAILAGSAAICGVVLIVADLLHQTLFGLFRQFWVQQSNPRRIADATAGHTPDASHSAAEPSAEERPGGWT